MTHQTPAIIALEEGWNEIRTNAIDRLEDILEDGLSGSGGTVLDSKGYIKVYTTCFDMCNQKEPNNHSSDLYDRHGEAINFYLAQTVLPALREKASQGGSILLSELQLRWSNHQIMNKWMTKFFSFLDRFYVKRQNRPTLSEAAMTHFKDSIYEEIKRDISTAIISLIEQEREGNMIDNTLIKTSIEFYNNISMGNLEPYTTDLEIPLLDTTREYYAKKREEWLLMDSTPEYLIKVEQALTEEENRVRDYLNPASEDKLLHVVEDEILDRVKTDLLHKEGSGCWVLLANDKSEDLQRMFRLFSRLENGLQPMASIVEKFICGMGNEIVQQRQSRLDSGEKDKNDDPVFVKAFLELHDKYFAVIKTDFTGHHAFQKAFKEAFVTFVNKNTGNYTNAEFMCTYCDRLLKSPKMSEVEVEDSLEKIVQLFSYLTEKDMFADIYRHQLARRILNDRSASNDAEKVMITKLKIKCGTQFTSKMEGMLNDLAIGADSRKEFVEQMKKHNSKIVFGVQVLTTGYWPTYSSPSITVPDEMTKCIDIFKTFHDQRHQQRKLSWVLSLGSASCDLSQTILFTLALSIEGVQSVGRDDENMFKHLQEEEEDLYDYLTAVPGCGGIDFNTIIGMTTSTLDAGTTKKK